MPRFHKATQRHFSSLAWRDIKDARSEHLRAPKTRFLMDENMEPWAAYVMRYKRFDVWESDIANLRCCDDLAVFAAAWRLGRLLVTHDADFLDDRLFPFSRCSGLLVVPTYGPVSMEFANLLAGACELVSKGSKMWFYTKIVAKRDFTVKVRTWEKSLGHIAEWNYRIAARYRRAASDSNSRSPDS
jgi:hypothetical protein